MVLSLNSISTSDRSPVRNTSAPAMVSCNLALRSSVVVALKRTSFFISVTVALDNGAAMLATPVRRKQTPTKVKPILGIGIDRIFWQTPASLSIANTIPAATPAPTLDLARATVQRHFPGQNPAFIDSVFARVQDLFAGRHPGYQACDTKFHDLTHTCDATACLVRILDGHISSGNPPPVSARDFELAVAAILSHDSGYIKETGDTSGTGAKYTLTHVERSARFAGTFLTAFGMSADEVRLAQVAIRCTGLRVDVANLAFRSDRERLLGCALGTGDMLGQLASETYPQRLHALYEEFRE